MALLGPLTRVVDDSPTPDEGYGGGISVRLGTPIPPKPTVGQVGAIAAVRKCVTIITAALSPMHVTWDVQRRVRQDGYVYYEPLDEPHPLVEVFENPSPRLDPANFWNTVLQTYCIDGTVLLVRDQVVRILDGQYLLTGKLRGFWIAIGRPIANGNGKWDIQMLPHPDMPKYPYSPSFTVHQSSLVPLAWPGTGWPYGSSLGPSPLAKFCQLASELILREGSAISKALQYQTYKGAFIIPDVTQVEDEEEAKKLARENAGAFAAAIDQGVPPTLSIGSQVVWPGGTVTNSDANFKAVTDYCNADFARAYALPIEAVDPKGSSRSWREVLDDANRSCFSVHANVFASALTHALLSERERKQGLRVTIDIAMGGTPYERLQYAEKIFVQTGLSTTDESRMMVGMRPLGGEAGRRRVIPRGAVWDTDTGNGGAEAAQQALEEPGEPVPAPAQITQETPE